jgi:hypothetical protein
LVEPEISSKIKTKQKTANLVVDNFDQTWTLWMKWTSQKFGLTNSQTRLIYYFVTANQGRFFICANIFLVVVLVRLPVLL